MSVCLIEPEELYPVLALMLAEALAAQDLERVQALRAEADAYLAENARGYRAWYGRDCAARTVPWGHMVGVLDTLPRRWQDLAIRQIATPDLSCNLPPDASEAALAFVRRGQIGGVVAHGGGEQQGGEEREFHGLSSAAISGGIGASKSARHRSGMSPSEETASSRAGISLGGTLSRCQSCTSPRSKRRKRAWSAGGGMWALILPMGCNWLVRRWSAHLSRKWCIMGSPLRSARRPTRRAPPG